jgi:hypothetical protein
MGCGSSSPMNEENVEGLNKKVPNEKNNKQGSEKAQTNLKTSKKFRKK